MKHVGLTSWERGFVDAKDGFNPLRLRELDYAGLRVSNPFWLVPERQLIYPCIEGVSKSRLHGVRPIGRCGKWDCQWCGDLLKGRLINEITHLRQVHDGLCVFSVLTFRGRESDALGLSGNAIGIPTQLKYVSRWRGAVKPLLGTGAYTQIPEWHKSGVMHINIVWYGVDRGFTSCNIINRYGSEDMRLQCRVCTACQMRDAWLAISGATRSTHSITFGGVAPYVAKYLTKDTIGQRYKITETSMKRYSMGRDCKRLPTVVPVYRWIGQTLRDNGDWRWGRRRSKLDEPDRDYLTDERLFLHDKSQFGGAHEVDIDGLWLPREACSTKHHGLCDRVPYWSPTKQRAWGYQHWEWFARVFGEDTTEMIQRKIKGAWDYIAPQLEDTPYDDYRH